MAKYKIEVDAVPYEEGMEDGFIHYPLGQSPEMGEFYANETTMRPRNCRVPAIVLTNGKPCIIQKGDLIVTDSHGIKFPINKATFDSLYIPIEE